MIKGKQEKNTLVEGKKLSKPDFYGALTIPTRILHKSVVIIITVSYYGEIASFRGLYPTGLQQVVE